MGYMSDVAFHVKGDKKSFTKVQEAYYEALEKTPVRLWSSTGSSVAVDSFLETRESYVRAGQDIWEELEFQEEGDHVHGGFFWKTVKWRRYFGHQHKVLCEVLTQHDYSWYYLRAGEGNKDIVMASNAFDIKNFHEDVLKSYIITHYHTTPILREVEEEKQQ